MSIADRFLDYRKLMEEKQMDASAVRSAGNHQIKYVGDFSKSRAYMYDFTDSVGTFVLTKMMHISGLWLFLHANRISINQ
ncbi:hypothetical protein ACTQ6A_06890 [Lachnospiraceae bacterium LCP25S3_G4]